MLKIVNENSSEYLNQLDKPVKAIKPLAEDFVIILDGTEIGLDKLKRITSAIDKYGFHTYLEDMQNEAEILKEYDSSLLKENYDEIVTVGDGGRRFCHFMQSAGLISKNVINLVWHRVWNQGDSLGFETDIDDYNFANKKILLIEDVVASGKSLYCVKREIESRGGLVEGVVCGIINESSPLTNGSFVSVLAAKKLESIDKSLDPFWYPPTYSLRHLIYGDEEMPAIYKEMNKHYFNNNDDIEKLIKEIRNDIL